jgi:DNA-directed RNA polymerase subunit RPC12/RpoP
MENNLKCNDCGEEFFLPSFYITAPMGITTFKDKSSGKKIMCPKCQESNISQIKKEGDYNCHFGKFGSLSSEQKKEVLKKRSSKHTPKAMKEQSRYIANNFEGQTLKHSNL